LGTRIHPRTTEYNTYWLGCWEITTPLDSWTEKNNSKRKCSKHCYSQNFCWPPWKQRIPGGPVWSFRNARSTCWEVWLKSDGRSMQS